MSAEDILFIFLISCVGFLFHKLFELQDSLNYALEDIDTRIIINKLFNCSNNNCIVEKDNDFTYLKYYDIILQIVYDDGPSYIKTMNLMEYYYDNKRNISQLFTDKNIRNFKLEITVHSVKVHPKSKQYFHMYNIYNVYDSYYTNTDVLHSLLNIITKQRDKVSYYFIEKNKCLIYTDGTSKFKLNFYTKTEQSPYYITKYYY